MNLIRVASAVISVAKAIPMVSNLLDKITGLWFDYKVSQIKEVQIDAEAKRNSLISAIQKAKTDAERIALSRVLHDYNVKQVQ